MYLNTYMYKYNYIFVVNTFLNPQELQEKIRFNSQNSKKKYSIKNNINDILKICE